MHGSLSTVLFFTSTFLKELKLSVLSNKVIPRSASPIKFKNSFKSVSASLLFTFNFASGLSLSKYFLNKDSTLILDCENFKAFVVVKEALI